MFEVFSPQPTTFARVAPRVGAYVSALIFLTAGVFYIGSWNYGFAAVIRRFDSVLFAVLVLVVLFTSWHEWQTPSEAEKSAWQSAGSSVTTLPSWMVRVWPLLLIFFVGHLLYLHVIAPRGFVVFRGGKFTDRSASEFVNILAHHAYLRLIAAEHRAFASFFLILAMYLLVYWWRALMTLVQLPTESVVLGD